MNATKTQRKHVYICKERTETSAINVHVKVVHALTLRVVQVTDELSSVIVAQLLFLESENPEKPISMYINSPGGSVTAGLGIYDTMQVSVCACMYVCIFVHVYYIIIYMYVYILYCGVCTYVYANLEMSENIYACMIHECVHTHV